uniref:Regulator of chromosome condensation domain-containing protein n=1 Tax=Rhabditophanes sp. KR3021 TaxID=114890 RepID=A0AC35UBN2_9BILA
MLKHSTSIYAAGLSTTGSFGIKDLVLKETAAENIAKPKKISYFNHKNVTKVSSGFGFSLFATRKKLYGCGLNNFNQIGNLKGTKSKEQIRTWHIHPKLLELPFEGKNIMDISSGRMHSLVATDSEVYGLGDNCHGQSGVGVAKGGNKLETFSKIELPDESGVRKVHCSLDTSFILTKCGNLYSFGLNTDGQVGNGKYGQVRQLHHVKGDLEGEKIVNIFGSTDTLLAINEKGDVFIWGQNEYGQMDLVTSQMQLNIPKRYPINVGKVVSGGSTGSSCIVCNDKGEVYVWGSQFLGLGPRITSTIKPIQIDPQIFANTGEKEAYIKSVFAGSTSMAARTNDKNIFTWGSNRYGELGLGKKDPQNFPFPVFLPKEVKALDLGYDHSLFLTY